jgi:hypothetical protein
MIGANAAAVGHAEQLYFASFDKARNGIDHSHKFIIEIRALGTGKNNKRFSPVAADLQGHIAVQPFAPQLVLLEVHCVAPLLQMMSIFIVF